MLKQKPIVYLAIVVGFGSLLLAGVPVDRVLSIGFVVFMLMMHLGGHGHGSHGPGGHQGHDTRGGQERKTSSSSRKEDEVAEK